MKTLVMGMLSAFLALSAAPSLAHETDHEAIHDELAALQAHVQQIEKALSDLWAYLTGGDDEGPLVAPDYDLTGCWEVREQPFCEANVLPAAELRGSGIDFVDPFTDEELEEVEMGFVAADPLRLQQDDNDLAITETDSGHRIYGSVSGDQVSFRDREDLLDFQTVWEAKGTALSKDVLALTVTYEFSSEEVEGVLVCEMRQARMIDAPAGCIEVVAGEPEP